MSAVRQKRQHTGNDALFIILATVYVSVLILFGSQTWLFVSWLFPDTQLAMKLLTVLCFDVMALLWACVDLMYQFASKGARTVVRWAWAISFVLSLLASIFYLVLESMFRFSVTPTPEMVNTGYGITIFAITLTVIFLTWFLYLEWAIRHPVIYAVEPVTVVEAEPAPQQKPTPVLPPSPPANILPFTINDWRNVQEQLKQVTSELEAIKSRPAHDPNNQACNCDVCVSIRGSGISPATGPVVSTDTPKRKKKAMVNPDGNPAS